MRPEAVLDLIEAGRIPVVSSVAPDVDGQIHNVNADTAAAALAVALGAEKLLVLTDVEGLYRDWPDSDDVIDEISPEALAELMPSLASGMVPKMGACLQAVQDGVPRATVVDGREPHAVLLELFTDEGVGTQVLPGVDHQDPEGPEVTRRDDQPGVDRALRRRADEHLRPAEAGAHPRRGRPRLGRGRQGVRRPPRRHRRQRARPRATRRWSTRSPTSSRTLGHVSNFFATEPQVALAEKLLALLTRRRRRAGRVFFTNSGAEANEAAFKLTRRTGRTHVVAAEGGFHGRTMGALALTSKAAYREPFEPLPGDVTFVPYGDAEALAAAVTDETAAVAARADPGRGRRGRCPRTATSPPPGGSPPSTARCSGSTRCRPASAAPAAGSRTTSRRPGVARRHRHRGQGPGRRLPDRRLPRLRRGRRRCSSPATTAPPSAATRSPARPPSP